MIVIVIGIPAAYAPAMQQHVPRQCSSILAKDDEVGILPVCGTVGDDLNGTLKKPPAAATLLEIKAAVGAFDPKGRC